MKRSARENFCFAAKLVRGAYMYSERELAEEENRDSPIHDSLDDTHASYDRNMESVLTYINKKQTGAEVFPFFCDMVSSYKPKTRVKKLLGCSLM